MCQIAPTGPPFVSQSRSLAAKNGEIEPGVRLASASVMASRLRRRNLSFLFLGLVLLACGARTPLEVHETQTEGPRLDAGVVSRADAEMLPPASDAASPADAGMLPHPDQKILFEVTFESLGWGYESNGYYVMADGSVMAWFAKRPPSEPAANHLPRSRMTFEELTRRHEGRAALSSTLPQGEVLARFAAVPSAATGALVWSSQCFDTGTRMFVGYTYEPQSMLYQRVVLAQDGDMTLRNDVAAARELTTWLAGVGSLSRFCEASNVSCDAEGTSSCKRAKCRGRLVSDCQGNCVNPSWCAYVSSCSQCIGTCVYDKYDRPMCTDVDISTDGLECEELGDKLCAGGKKHCRKREARVFSCENNPG